MKEILVKSLMSEGVSWLSPDTLLQQAVQLMVEQRHSCMVINQDNTPIGIITERDLIKVLNNESCEKDLSLPVTDFMSSPVFTLNENDNLFDAMVICRSEKIRHLPVVNNDEKLVGLVTQSDLANAHFRVIEMQSELIEKSIAAKTGELQQLNNELQALSMEDHLMQIGNRRAMEVDLEHIHSGSKRYAEPYSVLLIDVDNFKRYNDHYGHQAGDDALRSVADILKNSIRGSDRLYRYGGEELLLVLPHTSTEQADCVAKKMVSSVENAAIPHEKGSYGVLTISCGGTCVIKNDEIENNWEDVVKQADQNVYKAKNKGRNIAIVS